MTLQSSGAISLANIQSEFGGSNPISLSEYYRGGAYTTTNNTGVPTSGQISMSQFYGTTAFIPPSEVKRQLWAGDSGLSPQSFSWSTTGLLSTDLYIFFIGFFRRGSSSPYAIGTPSGWTAAQTWAYNGSNGWTSATSIGGLFYRTGSVPSSISVPYSGNQKSWSVVLSVWRNASIKQTVKAVTTPSPSQTSNAAYLPTLTSTANARYLWFNASGANTTSLTGLVQKAGFSPPAGGTVGNWTVAGYDQNAASPETDCIVSMGYNVHGSGTNAPGFITSSQNSSNLHSTYNYHSIGVRL